VDDRLHHICEVDLRMQCDLLLIGCERLEHAEDEASWLQAGPSAGHTWAALLGILVSRARISEILWGAGCEAERITQAARRKPLRDRLGVCNSSILNSTDEPKGFERFDQTSDTPVGAPGAGRCIPCGTRGPVVMIDYGDDTPRPFGRYDPMSRIVQLCGSAVNVGEVAGAARALKDRLDALAAVDRSPISASCADRRGRIGTVSR
jgi:hypothetical protein